jgi:hypothetical protein
MQIESKTFSVFKYLCSLSSSRIGPSFTCLIFRPWINIIVQQVCFKYYVNVKETVSYFYFLFSFLLSVFPDCLLEVNIYPEGPATNTDIHTYIHTYVRTYVHTYICTSAQIKMSLRFKRFVFGLYCVKMKYAYIHCE